MARHKEAAQSFSQVMKEHFGRRRTGRDLAEALDRATLAEATLDAVIEERRRDVAGPVDL